MLIDESIMFRMKEASRDASDAADTALTSTSEAKRAADDYSSRSCLMCFANPFSNPFSNSLLILLSPYNSVI